MEYMTDKGNLKEVVLFIAKLMEGNTKPQESEIAEIKWFDYKEAIDTITYENAKVLFEKVLKELN